MNLGSLCCKLLPWLLLVTDCNLEVKSEPVLTLAAFGQGFVTARGEQTKSAMNRNALVLRGLC